MLSLPLFLVLITEVGPVKRPCMHQILRGERSSFHSNFIMISDNQSCNRNYCYNYTLVLLKRSHCCHWELVSKRGSSGNWQMMPELFKWSLFSKRYMKKKKKNTTKNLRYLVFNICKIIRLRCNRQVYIHRMTTVTLPAHAHRGLII